MVEHSTTRQRRSARSAEKDIDRLDTQVRRRVIVAIRQVAEDPLERQAAQAPGT